MKIFNWVHRRFTHKGGFSQNGKKSDCVLAKDGDTQALLDNVVLADLLDGWKGGLLSIGTFGLEALDGLKEEKEYCCQYIAKDRVAFEEDEYSVEGECDYEPDLDEEEEEELEGELNPLVCSASINGLEGSNCDQAAPLRAPSSIIDVDGTPLTPRDNDHASHSSKWDRHCTIKKERVTLADLFSAESDGNTNSKNRKAIPQLMSKKPTPDAPKRGRSSSQKLIPGVKDDSRPLEKLHRLMKRMLKRKIHPDAEAKIYKDHRSKSSCAIGVPSDELGNNESISLLQIQEMVSVA